MDAGRVPWLKVMIMTIFVLMTQVPLAASQRNMSITLNSTRVQDYYLWDSSLKTDEKCLRFHDRTTPSLFFMWPEDLPQFRYCCGNYKETNVTANQFLLTDYVYHLHGTILQAGMYYDLVTVDECMPYWKCWHSEALDQHRNDLIYYTKCEVGDLQRLYTERFWKLAVAKYGILMSALPLIAFLEVGVLLATIALRPCGFATSPWKEIFTLWWRILSRVRFRSWLHLTLLTVVGNCFLEAIAHQDPYHWEANIMDSFAFVYLLLPIAVWIAAFLQQVVDWRVVDKCIRKARVMKCKPDAFIKERNLRAEFMDDDWKWQPIFMQLATLSMLGLYIRYGSDSQRTEFAALLLGLAAVAATWTAVVAVIIFFRKLDLLRKSFRNDFPADPPIAQRMSGPGSNHLQLHSNGDSKV